MDAKRIVCAGGDRRTLFLAQGLAEEGHRVSMLGFELAETPFPAYRAGEEADALLLPVPALREGRIPAPFARETPDWREALSIPHRGGLVAGAVLPRVLTDAAAERGLRAVDLYAEPGVAVMNAVPTAEGAIVLAEEHSDVTLFRSPALVIGYGRVGRALAPRLAALGARVTVSARKPEDLAQILSCGFTPMRTDGADFSLSGFRFIFNTVPVRVLDRARLRTADASALLMELASAPGGYDPAEAEALGLRALAAPGLPGRIAPATAADVLREALRPHLRNCPKG